MASCQTSRWVSTAPYAKLTVTQSSSTDTTVTLSCTVQYIADYAANTNGAGRAWSVKIGSTTVKSGSYNIDGKTGTNTVSTFTHVISKTTSTQSIAFSLSFAFNVTWSEVYGGTKTASGTISVPAKTSYKITYHANGGSGAPGVQTKWHGTTLTLSSTKPTRTGYSFLGWSTSSTATSATYAAGASYTANAAATLYAVWKANTYKIAYNANGGTGAPGTQTKTYGITLNLSTTKPTRTNYTFLGWATSASATTAAYAAGASYTANAAATLYAVWKLAYTKPKISSFSVTRCDSSGTTSEQGTYARVKFSWSTFNTVQQVKIEWSSASTATSSDTPAVSGTSGSIDLILGDGNLDVDRTYIFKVTVTDSGGSTPASRTLGGTKFGIDFLAGGNGAAIGKPAELSGYFDVGFRMRNRAPMTHDNNVMVYSLDTAGNEKNVFEGQNANNNTTVGYGNYSRKEGNTHVYGHDVMHYVSNIASPSGYRPYIRQGDRINVVVRTAGYVTNGGKDVSFTIPLSRPIVGSPTVTVSSVGGFTLRQGTKYTHGSSATATVVPDSYTATYGYTYGVVVTAVFSNVTDVTNNDSIGIYWSGNISFT